VTGKFEVVDVGRGTEKKKRGPAPKSGGGRKKMKVVDEVPPCPINLKAKGITTTSWSQ
jgi:hypothetical protein